MKPGLSTSLFFLFVVSVAQASTSDGLTTWINLEEKRSIEHLLRNISPQGAAPGTIVASPSKDSPNYYFHWVRDASLTMDQVVWLYSRAHGSQRQAYLKFIHDFIALSRRQQLEASVEGLGEPRYNIDGSPDTIPWSRPQFDGPALRALTLMHFLNSAPASERALALSVIRTDLEYVQLKWNVTCFDLWEELVGHHFYTQSVQYSALMSGRGLFASEGDDTFSKRLELTAVQMTVNLISGPATI